MQHPDYEKALKLGERAYKIAVVKGKYPYLPVLDDILNGIDIQAEEKLGVVDIPLDLIVGTKTAGRKNAFAVNFMPLMKTGTEFADKWTNVYLYQLNEGLREPILVYEFLNKYYVLEGNKRVSVFKYLNASSIEGNVIRIIPKRSDSLENKIYYEFMEFYKYTKINDIWFSKEGSFSAFVKATGREEDYLWTKEDRDEFSSDFTRFRRIYDDKGGRNLGITAGDAFLFYLSLYPYEEIKRLDEAELKKQIEKIWGEFEVLDRKPEDTLVLAPEEEKDGGILELFHGITNTKSYKVAFLHDRQVKNSSWSYGHELGRAHIEEVFGERIVTSSYFLEDSGLDAYELMEKAIKDGNKIIFAANQKFLKASLKLALEYPDVKILNCSVNKSFKAIRTYYGRMYEAKFLCGMVAGAMTQNDKIAYRADYPIYGSFANINAFALGAKMVNPRAKVYVSWACDKKADIAGLLRENDIYIMSDTDMIRIGSYQRKYGLYMLEGYETVNLASPMWNWGKFYEKMIRDILDGNWKADAKGRKAVNYWWGISSNIIDMILSKNLPEGITTLTQMVEREIHEERFNPFQGEIKRQDGSVIGCKDGKLSPEEVITMNWLADNVVGEVPEKENMTEEALALLSVQEGMVFGAGDDV